MGRIMLATSANTDEEYGGNVKESKVSENFSRGGIDFQAVAVNQIVFLKMLSGETTSSLSNGDILGTIPDEYKPYKNTDYRDTYSNKRFFIKTNGDIEVKESIPSGTALRGSFTYIQL